MGGGGDKCENRENKKKDLVKEKRGKEQGDAFTPMGGTWSTVKSTVS